MGEERKTAENKKEITKHYYFYLKEPVQERYYEILHTEPKLSFKLNDILVKFYSLNEKVPVELMVFEIDESKGDHELIANSLKEYITSIIKLTYSLEFKFSHIQPRVNKTYFKGEPEPNIDDVGFRFEYKPTDLRFNKENFLRFLQYFSQKPLEVELFTESLDFTSNPLIRYAQLYKIIEFTYHFEGMPKAKSILKGSSFAEVCHKFNYDGKTGNELIDFIVDLRDKCDHLKKRTNKKEKYGFALSNIHDRRLVHNFIPTMQKICAKVISPDLEVQIPQGNVNVLNETPLKQFKNEKKDIN